MPAHVSLIIARSQKINKGMYCINILGHVQKLHYTGNIKLKGIKKIHNVSKHNLNS